jgi:ADP-ribose pyrophosphatase
LTTPHPNRQVRPWKLLSSSKALDEKWFQVRKDVVQLPSGKIIDDYFLWDGPHIVTVVAVTTEGKFVMVRQYRHAIGEIKLQFPAGAVDSGESFEEAAERELREEAGYATGRPLIHLGTVSPYGTKLTGKEDFYLALDAIQQSEPHYDEQEESEVLLMSEDELWQLIESKETHMMTLVAGFLFATRYFDTRQSGHGKS